MVVEHCPGRKVALVTGAGKPGALGVYLAQRLDAGGYAVALHYHTHGADAQSMATQLDCAAAFHADLTSALDAERLIGEVTAHFGRLDVLINNVGVYHMQRLYELSEVDWHHELGSTATAVFFTTRAAIPWLRRSGVGRVINIGDAGAGKLGPRDLAMGYHIGKTGVLLLTHSFARLEAKQGITVNMVSPGILQNSIDLDRLPRIPIDRVGTFEDVWNVIEFFLKPESQYATGNHVRVSGGWNL